MPFHSDYDHPTVFWIMNGWNEFVGNMAAGAGTCGACYWLVPGANSAHSRHQTWTSYASMQAPLVDSRTIPPTPLGNALARAATTPLKLFRGNYCTSAANSFNTVDNTSACLGVNKADRNTGFVHLQAVPNPLAPKSCLQHNPVQDEPNEHKYVAEACALHPDADSYYPKVGGLRKPTLCSGEDTDCSKAIICNSDPEANFDKPVAEANCTVTAIDRYTSSFNFTETNFGAIWLRPQWYLMINSVLTDIQNGGVTFVTGGGYTASDVIHGHWALARKNVFIGQTQPVPGQPPPSEANPYVSAAGPVNPKGLTCDKNADGSPTGNYCLVAEEGISYPLSSFGLNQRFFNIYDGPAYQEANAYLNIKQTPITDCSPADSPENLLR